MRPSLALKPFAMILPRFVAGDSWKSLVSLVRSGEQVRRGDEQTVCAGEACRHLPRQLCSLTWASAGRNLSNSHAGHGERVRGGEIVRAGESNLVVDLPR